MINICPVALNHAGMSEFRCDQMCSWSLQPALANLSHKFTSIKFSSLSVSFLPNEPCGSEASLSSRSWLHRSSPAAAVLCRKHWRSWWCLTRLSAHRRAPQQQSVKRWPAQVRQNYYVYCAKICKSPAALFMISFIIIKCAVTEGASNQFHHLEP